MDDGFAHEPAQPQIPWIAWIVALGIGFGEVAWATRTYGFFQDDFIFLGQGRTLGTSDRGFAQPSLSFDYLTEPLFEHFSPVTRGLFWLAGRFDNPLLAARLIMLVIILGVVVGFAELVRAVLGRTLPAVLLCLIAIQGLVITRLAGWTTAGFNTLPAVACCALSLSLGVRYLRARVRPWVGVASVALFGVACLDYELAMLLPGFLAAWVLAVALADGSLADVQSLVRRTWIYWFAMLIVAVAALVNFRLNYYIDSIPRGTVRSTADTLWFAAWQGLFPGVLGIWNPVPKDFGAGPFVAFAIWLIIVVLVMRAGGRRVVPFIALAGSGWLVFTGLLGYARSTVNGTGIGVELFYAAFPLLILLFGASAVVARRRRSFNRSEGSETDGRFARVRAPVDAAAGRVGGIDVLVLGALVLGSAVMLQVNARSVMSYSGVASASRDFANTFLDDVDSFDRPVAVLSTRVPEHVVFPMFFPYDWASRSIGELTTGVRWNDNSQGDLHRIDAGGSLIPVELSASSEATVVDDPTLSSATALADRAGCFRFDSNVATLRFAIGGPVGGDQAVVTFAGTISTDSPVQMTAIGPDVVREFNGDLNRWNAGSFFTVHALDATAITEIQIGGLRPAAELCLDSVLVSTINDRR